MSMSMSMRRIHHIPTFITVRELIFKSHKMAAKKKTFKRAKHYPDLLYALFNKI